MRTSRSVVVAVLLLFSALSFAQSTPRLPFITGNEVVNVLVETDGTVKTWGDPWRLDMSPTLGDGKKTGPNSAVDLPRLLPGVNGIVSAAVGPTHVLLLKNDGTVLAWGGNDSCEVGSKEKKAIYGPVPVPGLRGVRQVVAGYVRSAAILDDGSLWMWGSLEDGPIQNDCVLKPTRIDGVSGVKKVSIDTNAVLVLKDDGTVVGWGLNKRGELCDGTTEKRLTPMTIKGLSNVVDLVSGDGTYFLLADGTVKTCGGGPDGTMKPVFHKTPFLVPGVAKAGSIRAGNGTTWVTLADNTLLGWGNGYHGALGDGFGDRENSRPHPPKGLGPVVAHYLSGGVSYALKPDGTVLQWGIIAPEGHREPDGRKTEFYLTPAPAFKVNMQ